MPPSNMKAMAMEHEGDGHGHHRAPQRRVLGRHAEGHQRASAHQQPEVGRVAGPAQDVVMEVPIGHTQLAQLLFRERVRGGVLRQRVRRLLRAEVAGSREGRQQQYQYVCNGLFHFPFLFHHSAKLFPLLYSAKIRIFPKIAKKRLPIPIINLFHCLIPWHADDIVSPQNR